MGSVRKISLLLLFILVLVSYLQRSSTFSTRLWLNNKSMPLKDDSHSHALTHSKLAITGTSYGKTRENMHRAGASPPLHGYRQRSRSRRSATEIEALNSCPCSIQFCAAETIVNCQGLSLKDVNSTWFPKNTTAILLDNNNMEVIDNSSFTDLIDLRILNLSNNNIKHIQPSAFRGLENLETLNLEYNQLTEASYPSGIFDHLVSLKNLKLWKNKERSNLPGNLFQQLKNLIFLTTDVTGNTLTLENELRNLTRLVLTGDVKNIDDTSFHNVPKISQLFINDFLSLSNFTDMALRPLCKLDFLELSNACIGVTKSLQSLKPLIGKNMTTIAFSRVYFSSSEAFSSLYHNEGILDSEKTKYLMQICVRDFSLVNSDVFVIQANAFIGHVWNSCIRSVDLSFNPLTGTKLAVAVLINYKHLEMLNIENALRTCYDKDSYLNERADDKNYTSPFVKQTQVCDYNTRSLTKLLKSVDNKAMNGNSAKEMYQQQHQSTENSLFDGTSIKNTSPIFNSKRQVRCSYSMPSREAGFPGYLRIYITKSLKYVKAKTVVKSGYLNINAIFVGENNLVYLDLRDSGLRDFTGNIIGLDALQTLMLSGNDLSLLSETFFDGVCHLEELDLSNCRLNADFMFSHSFRAFMNLLNLKRIDLSSNLLYSLKPGTFASNRKLEKLDMSKNRFKNIPFDLQNTPTLKFLDLRENAITSLDPYETDELEKLSQQPGGFSLFIAGNILSCGCDSLRFLHWLETTSVYLDEGKNFTCINTEGHLSYLSAVTDLESLWRKCWGEFFLFLAVILLFSMAVGFLSVFFVWKNKTFLIYKVMQMLVGYKPKGPTDYQTGVLVGYADEDYMFPCFRLREFLEDELKFSTYIYHRDNNPSFDMASSIVDAINDSWRIILVFSKTFLLNDKWSLFTARNAIYAMTPENPARVVVLVEENFQHRLPPEVLRAVPEDSIIVVSKWEMSYDLCNKLRVCLQKS